MTEKELRAQTVVANSEVRVSRDENLTLWQAITMSVVAILAVAVGTIYGTLLF